MGNERFRATATQLENNRNNESPFDSPRVVLVPGSMSRIGIGVSLSLLALVLSKKQRERKKERCSRNYCKLFISPVCCATRSIDRISDGQKRVTFAPYRRKNGAFFVAGRVLYRPHSALIVASLSRLSLDVIVRDRARKRDNELIDRYNAVRDSLAHFLAPKREMDKRTWGTGDAVYEVRDVRCRDRCARHCNRDDRKLRISTRS